MRRYETMLLLDPRLDDAAIGASIDRFTTLVTERGGTADNVDRWGRRRLAHEIDDLQEGFYAIVTYHLEPSSRHELEAALPFVEGLVRTKTVVPEAKTRKP
ncbi:MAG TPA: 30S ribosomal protein S6 [Actinomycetota bacterium]|nr:30S ribosomal protein S6 [Actinomycetota bacterium]